MKEKEKADHTAKKENEGRALYLQWLIQKPEVHHCYFTQGTSTKYDCLFLSGGTLVIADIKKRDYKKEFFDTYGVEVDHNKCAFLYRTAKQLEALPVILTFTQEGEIIISDISRLTPEDVTIQSRPKDNFDFTIVKKKVCNLKNTTIN